MQLSTGEQSLFPMKLELKALFSELGQTNMESITAEDIQQHGQPIYTDYSVWQPNAVIELQGSTC